ncbi:ABC transporter ATP-binding protein [Microbacterium paludicola]|uniref:ABC transporter ATP-binding protein n=1 Tax=Microbacterium paludicola TaxID=300019 RepID=UPI001ADD7270|nr:ABC transporter ATP-binding protein [Microbacterium paludicola]
MSDALLSIRSLSRSFPHGIVALRDASLELGRGETLALVGPSGAGKSTLLSLIGLLDSASSGEHVFMGHDVRRMAPSQQTALRRTAIGFVFQAFHLVPHLTARQNVELGLRARGMGKLVAAERAERALSRVGLHHRSDAYPSTLSGGEQQRVAIARATAVRPALLLCDEPTGNLDSRNSASVLALLTEERTPEGAMIIVTHDPDVAASCSRVITVSDGCTIERIR